MWSGSKKNMTTPTMSHPHAGLKLKPANKNVPLQSFSCCLVGKSLPFDWLLVTKDEVAPNHVCFHELQMGDNLDQLLKEFGEGHAKAVILSNTEDSYQLKPEFLMNVEDVDFSLLLVMKSDGEAILRWMEKEESILVQVDTENRVWKYIKGKSL